MAGVGIYLNLIGDTEEAFAHYRSLFGGEYTTFQRMRDVPPSPDQPPVPENEQDKVMHVELPIVDGTALMGTDMLESMGHTLRTGNNMTISLDLDDLGQAQRIFDGLAEGGTDVMPLQPMFWGASWGTCCDRFGVRWMFNVRDAG